MVDRASMCCCETGYLDFFIRTYPTEPAADNKAFRVQSVTPNDTFDVTDYIAEWSISLTPEVGHTLNQGTSNVQLALPNGDAYFFTRTNNVAPSKTYLPRINTLTTSEIWTKNITDDSVGAGLVYANSSGAGCLMNPTTGHEYGLFTAAGAFTNYTTSSNSAHWSPLMGDYSNTGILECTTPVPLSVSYRHWPLAGGMRITSCVLSGSYPSKSFTAEWEFVVGDVDFTIEAGLPAMSSNSTFLGGFSISGTVNDASGDSEAVKDAKAKQAIGQRVLGLGTGPGPTVTFSDGDIGGAVVNMHISGIKNDGLGYNTQLSYYERTEAGNDVMFLSVDTYVSGSRTGSRSSLYIDSTEYDFETTALPSNIWLTLEPTASSDVVLVGTKENGTGVDVYAINSTGATEWSQIGLVREGISSAKGYCLCCSDRYAYLTGVERLRSIANSVPQWNDGTYGHNILSGDTSSWKDWAVSLDGTRWNPVRYLSTGDWLETFIRRNSTNVFTAGDCIKNSAADLSPPDTWF